MTEDTINALIAPASALLGTAIGLCSSVLMHWLEGRRRRADLLREKYELLAARETETLHWAGQIVGCTSLESLVGLEPPARPLLNLALVYFPELRPAAKELLNASTDLQKAVTLKLTRNPEAPATFSAAKERMLAARATMDAAIEKHAQKYAMR